MIQTDPPRPPQEVLPTRYDLPSEDPEEPGLPDELSRSSTPIAAGELQFAQLSSRSNFRCY